MQMKYLKNDLTHFPKFFDTHHWRTQTLNVECWMQLNENYLCYWCINNNLIFFVFACSVQWALPCASLAEWQMLLVDATTSDALPPTQLSCSHVSLSRDHHKFPVQEVALTIHWSSRLTHSIVELQWAEQIQVCCMVQNRKQKDMMALEIGV